ncbi:MAG: NnrS family protein [Rhodocyclaceae bacterium]
MSGWRTDYSRPRLLLRGAFKVDILRDPRLDLAIKWLVVILVFGQLLPATLTGVLEFTLALLLLARFSGWHPRKAFSRIDIGIMYLGYLAIVLQPLINAIGQFAELPWVGSVSAPQFYPAGYMMWLHLASTGWCVAFGLLLWRYLPFLLTPRVDGKVN